MGFSRSTTRDVLYTERFVKSGPPPYGVDHRMIRNQTHTIIRLDAAESFYSLDTPFEYEGPELSMETLTADEQAICSSLSDAMDAQLVDMPFDL